MDKNDFTTGLYRELGMEEAISHRVHSRIFEILGYLDLLERNELQQEDRLTLLRIEDLCRKLINEMHMVIDYYKK